MCIQTYHYLQRDAPESKRGKGNLWKSQLHPDDREVFVPDDDSAEGTDPLEVTFSDDSSGATVTAWETPGWQN